MDPNPLSCADLNRISLRVKGISSLREREMLGRLRDILRSVVDPVNGLANDDPRHLIAAATASVYLEAVGEVSVHFYRRASVANLVNSYADKLLPWVRYFYQTKIQNRLDPIHLDEDEKQRLIRNLSSVFLALTFATDVTKSFHPLIRPNYDIIVGLWFEEDAQNSIFARTQPPYPSEILWLLLGFLQPDAHQPLTEKLVLGADGDTHRVTSLALDKLRKAMAIAMKTAPSKLTRLSIMKYHTIILALVTNPDHIFDLGFQQHQTLTTLTKATRLLSEIPVSVTDVESDLFSGTFTRYFSNFTTMILGHSEDGTRAIRQCIRYGALDCIAQHLMIHGSVSKQDPEASILEPTLHLLRFSLAIRSICVDIRDIMKRLPPPAKMPRSPGREMWMRFMDEVCMQCVFLKEAELEAKQRKEIRNICSRVRVISSFL